MIKKILYRQPAKNHITLHTTHIVLNVNVIRKVFFYISISLTLSVISLQFSYSFFVEFDESLSLVEF